MRTAFLKAPPQVALFALTCTLLLSACAAAPDVFTQIPEGDYRERIQRQEADDVRVSAAVPSAKETADIFGKPLYKRGIQPVWLKIENNRDEAITFLPVGLDPHYFSPLEVANLDATASERPESLVDEFFLDQSISLVIRPGEQLSGFVFSKLDEGTKAFNVDIVGADDFNTFTFFIQVPGLQIDHYTVDWRNLYSDDQWMELEQEQLIAEIEKYECCVKDKAGKNTGDPLNLVLIGMPGDIYTAFIRAGWDETETVTRASSWKTLKSFLRGGEYRYSPISSLYVFGRPQDVAFQKARENIHERNHLRLWMSRATYQGLPVWIGQISRDIGVRFTTKTITTHKIDPNVDETREYLLENLAYAQSLKAFGYVGGVGEVPMEQPRGNLTGDPWFTDGYRLVLWVSSKPTPISALQPLEWRIPYSISRVEQ
ncbi:MAG TPA: LssY C-terminal domain-containing protein [Xanthomonadales bacterium]|nr:LssY C-terminal domain-containing protein [Xanthomonadales bacterium]